MLGIEPLRRPAVAIFDVIGTLFPLEPLRADLVALGLPPDSLETWFATGLRDAFALAAAGDFQPFSQVLAGALTEVLGKAWRPVPADKGQSMLDRMATLPPRPDAEEAFAVLRQAGIRIVALSNGAAASTRSLLRSAGLDGSVEHILSVDDVKLSKPRPEVYVYAVTTARVAAGATTLIAMHPWDINGAKAAGLGTAYVGGDGSFPATMRKPDTQGASLLEIARGLAALPAGS